MIRAAFLSAALLLAAPALAQGPGWGYVDVARVRATPQIDETGYGWAGTLSIPLDDRYFLSASAERMDAAYDAPSTVTERFELATAGVGFHTVERSVHIFGRLDYAEKRRTQYAPSGVSHEPAGGVGGALGARWLATPWLSVEGQYGIKGYVIDGFTKLDVGLRVLPHAWLLGTFDHGPFSGNEFRFGVRWAWDEYSPMKLPGARLENRRAALVPGQRLTALRTLVPQVRPAAGAPEVEPMAAGTQFTLLESVSNSFGTWWRIGAGAWIREDELLGQPE